MSLRLNKRIVNGWPPRLINEINGVEWDRGPSLPRTHLLKERHLVSIKLSCELGANPWASPVDWMSTRVCGGGKEQLSWGEEGKPQEQHLKVNMTASKRHHLTNSGTDSFSLGIPKYPSRRHSWSTGEGDSQFCQILKQWTYRSISRLTLLVMDLVMESCYNELLIGKLVKDILMLR